MHKLVAFEAVIMPRSELKPADYNPRDMTTDERSRLRRGLNKLGLLEPIIHNKRTGNMVGGHQRLKELDRQAKGKEYSVPVAVVDLSEAEEREANVLLNNPDAMGAYDTDKLWELFKFPDIDIDGTGFTSDDIYRLFGSSPFHDEENLQKLAEVNQRLAEAAERYKKETKGGASKRDSEHFYSVVVFKDDDERTAFTDALGLDDNRYIDGRLLQRLLQPQAT